MELLVLREAVHAQPTADYAEKLRSRLPSHTIRHARTPREERRLIETADVATGPRIDESLVAAADRLRLFASSYAGYDHLPLDAFADAGIALTNATGVHAENGSEHVVGAMLTFSRRFHKALRAEAWTHDRPSELAGSTATIVGLGAIGVATAERLAAFDVETIGIRRSPDRGGPTDEVFGPDRLHEALAETDYLVLCCPLTESTRGLISHEEFVTLPPDSIVVNVARGEVIDTDALVEALRRGKIRGAALDVTDPEPLPEDHPLWAQPEVLLTPHTAGATPNYYDRIADIVADNVERLTDGRELRNRVHIGEND